MLGKSLLGGRTSSSAQNRTFLYEVSGLKQNEQNDSNSYPLRTSSSIFIQVPFNRMNQEMLRIVRMGGKIESIRPLNQPEKN